MEKGRIKHIKKNKNIEGDYILYWMQQSQRIKYNHALNAAVILSNLHNIPLLVYFGITDDFPDGNLRHYTFMAEGLDYLKSEFNKMGVEFIIYNTSPEKGCIKLMENAAYLVMDKGYLRIQKNWRNKVIEESEKIGLENIMIVESDVVVPIEEVSDKEEYAARTIRPKITKHLDDYAVEMEHIIPEINSLDISLNNDFVKVIDPIKFVKELNIDKSIKPSKIFKGGEKEGRKKFKEFYNHSINHYLDKNHPEFIYNSFLSPYLHFGHISPVEIVVKLNKLLEKNPHIKEPMDDFIEELVIRRELAINFIYYNEKYDEFDNITYDWAYKTMEDHVDDDREYIYSLEKLENYNTHDKYWNTSMKEMVQTGFMHTYMRMYWCKKILEWSPDYETAYKNSLYLNNKYFIDGRDPNSFTGIAWCFGKHDRAWKERPIFGKLRYMNSNGLERKFDMQGYIDRVEKMIGD